MGAVVAFVLAVVVIALIGAPEFLHHARPKSNHACKTLGSNAI